MEDRRSEPGRNLLIKNISKTFGNSPVLKNVSLSIPLGSTYALLGPNGSGKTVLLKSLMGSVYSDSGTVDMNGQCDVHSAEYKRKITYMPQYPGFLPHLSAKESIELLIQLRQQVPKQLERLVAELGIHKFWQRPFGELSGGMKQKINILQCFMFESEIIFLDEPTASLDPQISSYLKNLIREFCDSGKTILFTSHIMSEVEQVADYMALLSNGEILLESSPKKFVVEQNAENLEQAMLRYWSGNEL